MYIGSIQNRVIPETKKMVLDPSLLNIQTYKIRIKDNRSNPGKEVAPTPTLLCSRY